MIGNVALKIEATTRRIAALECSLRVFRQSCPAAAARVGQQLDEAYGELDRLEELQWSY